MGTTIPESNYFYVTKVLNNTNTTTSWSDNLSCSITIKDSSSIICDDMIYTGKDIRELLEMKPLIEKLLKKSFPQNYL